MRGQHLFIGAGEPDLADGGGGLRLFQRETGMNYRLWRQRQRLLASLNALEAGDSVTGAALDSGYDSTSAYIAAFKGLFGFTPGELFRQR